ncbi:MAG TPA: Rv3654c family TadE-like protein [Nocardioides sp.]|uniref:Rv3654c family TadE-like protein n=1 Tax=Nocardioides sp. TaxID=35761 RepID=UPI002F42FE9D
MSPVRDERGSATLLVLAMCGVLVLLAAALAVVTAMVAAHRAAQSAADLAALAGARGLAEGRNGCAQAAEVARANEARLAACAVTGRVVDVVVRVSGPRWLGQTADLAARSRAGPAP